jgi:peptide/nickel transport system substrate-binding protein
MSDQLRDATDQGETESEPTDRRRVLQLLGASTTVALAGCPSGGSGSDGGGSGSGSQDGEPQGERVPELVLEYWAGLGGDSVIFEDTSPVVQEAANALGMQLEISPVEFTEQIGHVASDTRTHDISYWSYGFAPDRLDPDEWCRRFSVTWAGGDGQHNPSNWANCEYTRPAEEQARAASESERRELVTESQRILTENYAAIPVAGSVSYTAYRSDEIDLAGAGQAGINRQNPEVYVESTPKNGDSFTAYSSTEMLETTNFAVIESSTSQGPWNKLIHSTLTGYGADLELGNVLAKEWEVSDDGRTITVELKDATFHNGDPVTAEDVKFTFEQLVRYPGTYTQASQPPYASIDVIDEKTTEFNLERPFLPLVSRVWPRWGIFHRDTWVEGGAQENPEDFAMDPVIGSGPFQVSQLERGSFLELEPHDGHPTMSPDHNVVFRVFREAQAQFQALASNELQMASALSPGLFERASDTDGVEAVSTVKHTPFGLYPQTPKPPLKFETLRQALGMALNRKKMNDLGFLGESEPEFAGTLFTNVHPWRPPDEELTMFTDDPEGDVEGARELLLDAGYTFDDDGNLHYPADADLSPRWPAEEKPPAGEFPCLEEYGG